MAGRTNAQRLLIALGALAGAVLAIGGVIAAGANLVGGDRAVRVGPADEEVQEIANQSTSADEFVRFLLGAAGGAPVQLNHQVLTPRGDGHFRLEYDCAAPTGCSFVRLEAGQDIPAEIPNGVWYQGCWSITKDGAGYRAAHLDIEFRRQGDTCPS